MFDGPPPPEDARRAPRRGFGRAGPQRRSSRILRLSWSCTLAGIFAVVGLQVLLSLDSAVDPGLVGFGHGTSGPLPHFIPATLARPADDSPLLPAAADRGEGRPAEMFKPVTELPAAPEAIAETQVAVATAAAASPPAAEPRAGLSAAAESVRATIARSRRCVADSGTGIALGKPGGPQMADCSVLLIGLLLMSASDPTLRYRFGAAD